ncbi:hypothetical protein DPMN_047923 [Dreissena polymorpha]|uniref:Uncharacterized protein n=1 Tax=Dreissena polymorpha TaxID=45954 RepID=A0A9D4I1X8_DREPO|nr:hypothetical protein DPMN_047923 [Dreissena polymorpha]
MSSAQDSEACCKVVQKGSHILSLLRFQPQELGGWGSCCLLSDCPQQNPAW